MAGNKPTYEELEAEVARLRGQVASGAVSTSQKHRTQSRWKSAGLGLLIAAGCIALVVANLSLWANRNLISQTGYDNLANQVIKEPAVQTAIATAAKAQFTAHVDIQSLVRQVLPDRAAFLAGTIATQVTNGIGTALNQVVSGPKFQQVWVIVNSRAHARVVNGLEHYSGNGQIDLEDAYKYLGAQLAGTPLAAVANTSLPAKYGSVILIDAQWLPTAQAAYKAVTWAPFVGFLIAVLCLVGALWWSRRKRRTLIGISVAVALSLVVTMIVVRVVRDVRIGQIHGATYQAASQAVWHTFLTPLFSQTIVWIVAAIVIAMGAWLTGPYRSAAGVRRGWRHAGGSLYRATGNFGAESPAVVWLKQNRRAVEWTMLVLDLVVLAFLTPLTVGIVAWAVVVLLVLVAVIEIITTAQRNATAGGAQK